MFQAAQIISLFSISFVLLSTCTFMVNIYISQYFQAILHIIMIWQSIKINCNLISFVIFIAHCHQNMPFSLSNPNILKPYMLILRWKRSLRMSLRKVFSRSTLAGTTWTWNSPGTWRGRKWHCWRRFRLPRKAWTGYIFFFFFSGFWHGRCQFLLCWVCGEASHISKQEKVHQGRNELGKISPGVQNQDCQ